MSDIPHIEYEIGETSLGWLLLAATPRGVCLVRFGAAADRLREELEREFSFAVLKPAGARVRRFWRALEGCVQGRTPEPPIPLDVAGSRFQQRVWRALRQIPCGETRSYALVARAIGRPEASRAVAGACATNPVPLLVPCHRVVRSDGQLGGYAFGVERKRQLLRVEGEVVANSGARSDALGEQRERERLRVEGAVVANGGARSDALGEQRKREPLGVEGAIAAADVDRAWSPASRGGESVTPRFRAGSGPRAGRGSPAPRPHRNA